MPRFSEGPLESTSAWPVAARSSAAGAEDR